MRLLALGAVIWLGGCVPFQTVELDGERFEALQKRDLVGTDQRARWEKQVGKEDEWTSVMRAWVSFAMCESIGSRFRSTNDLRAEVHLVLLEFESVRREILVSDRGWSAVRGTVSDSLLQPDHWVRYRQEVQHEVNWPAAREKWGDELPSEQDIIGSCQNLGKLTPREQVERLESVMWPALKLLVEEAQGGPLAEPLYLAVGWSLVNLERLEKDGSVLSRELEDLIEIFLKVEVPDSRSKEIAQVELNRARWARSSAERLVFAQSASESASSESADYWYARYLVQKSRYEAGEWERLATEAELPPRNHPVFTAMLWRSASAAKKANRPEVFLRIAMQAFEDRSLGRDPFVAALYRSVLELISEYPFDERVAEIVENLGPRNQTFARWEDLARISLDRGYPENASAIALRLLSENSDARSHARYHGILALSAFLDDDEARFVRHTRQIAKRDERVLSALGTGRRASFYSGPDEEFARILRTTLPIMAEWGESAEAREMRERWLRVLVDEIQRFLRSTEESVVRPKLLGLYRIASESLADHPRGYAQRLGTPDSTLVIGTVRVPDSNLEVHEPKVEVSELRPFSVLMVPSDGAGNQWELLRGIP